MKSSVSVNTAAILLLVIMVIGVYTSVYTTPKINYDYVLKQQAALKQQLDQTKDTARNLESRFLENRAQESAIIRELPTEISRIEEGFLANAERVSQCIATVEMLSRRIDAIEPRSQPDASAPTEVPGSTEATLQELFEAKITDPIDLPKELTDLALRTSAGQLTQDQFEQFLDQLVSLGMLRYQGAEGVSTTLKEQLLQLYGLYKTINGILGFRRMTVIKEAKEEKSKNGAFVDVTYGDMEALKAAQESLTKERGKGSISVEYLQNLGIQRVYFVSFKETPALVDILDKEENATKHLLRDVQVLIKK